ncbi:MAG: YadA-like family protein, partial [Alphaproteobacteria bacterium]|nr:YadA-like family protein [Alphaproteobacteria bacterium]
INTTLSGYGDIVTHDANEFATATDLATTNGKVTANETAISGNTADISSLKTRTTTAEGKIAANEAAIAGNTADISSLKTRTTTAEGNIATNAAAISANETAIATNTSDISSLKTRTSTAEGKIAANEANIATNTADITSLTTRTTTAEGKIAQNSSDIASNSADIAQNTADIAGLDARMDTAEGNIAANAAAISANETAIATNTSDISSLKTRTTTAEGKIAANEANIATNTSDIASLKTRTTTAEGKIAANEANIATNTADISSLKTRVNTAEGKIAANEADIIILKNDVVMGANSVSSAGYNAGDKVNAALVNVDVALANAENDIDNLQDIVGDPQVIAATGGLLNGDKIGSGISLVDAIDKVANSAAGLDLDNTFTGNNTFEKRIAAENGIQFGNDASAGIMIDGSGKAVLASVEAAGGFKVDADNFLDSTGLTAAGADLSGDLSVAGTTTLSATNGLQFGNGTNVTSIDDGSAPLSAKDASQLATVSTVLTSAENADFTATGNNIASATTISNAIHTLDTEIGADSDYQSANNGVDGANSVKANINAINSKLGNVTDVAVNGSSATDLTTAVSDLNTNMVNVLGGMYATDGSYAKLTGNGFENGANLTAQLTDYAENVAAATGTTYGTDGSYTNNYSASSISYGNIDREKSLAQAIGQIAHNVGDEVNGAKGNIAADNTVNENLDAIDLAIGDRIVKNDLGADYSASTSPSEVTSALSRLASNIGSAAAGAKGNVDGSLTINENLDKIDTNIGDISTFAASTTGNLTNGGETAPVDVATTINNIDKTLGKIHGLYKNGTVNSTVVASTVNGNSNLASGTTVEDHLVSLDNAIGDRTLVSLNQDINNAMRNESVAAGVQAAGNAIGDMNFEGSRYISDSPDLSSAVRRLDSGLAHVEGQVYDLRRDFKRGMASMAAMTALVPNSRSLGDTSISLGTGAYDGHTGVAIGGFHYLTDNILLNAGAGWGNSRDAAYRLGVTYSF